MIAREHPFISEEFHSDNVSPAEMDALLASGWRHFGTHFFRYSHAFYGFDVRLVIPLRIRLSDFALSRSQRRTLNRNADLTALVRPIEISTESEQLFEKHKTRFKDGMPDSVFDFLSRRPSIRPCDACEIAVYMAGRLIAVSYFDVASNSMSGIYAMFDPAESRRRLGIFTMLKEIEFAIASGKEFYYQGYAYEGSSFYDYKKQFNGSEWFDWMGNWKRFE